jgi:hypothetical protein
MNRIKLALITGGALFATPVFAQDATDPAADPAAGGTVEAGAGAEVTTPTPDPNAPVEAPTWAPSLTLVGSGKILIAGSTLNINMSADAVGKPISLSPSVWYGVSDKLSVGLTHDQGTTPFTPRPGLRVTTIPNPLDPTMSVQAAGAGGICFTGEDNGCPKVYDNVGVDALYGLSDSKFSMAAHPGLDVFAFDPFILQLRVGLLGRYMASEKLSIVFDPRITIGLTERDVNKEAIDVPVWVWFNVNEKLGAYVSTGIAGPFDGFGDSYRIPLQIGATYAVSSQLSVGGDFEFFNLLGSNSSADGRMLALRVAYRL